MIETINSCFFGSHFRAATIDTNKTMPKKNMKNWVSPLLKYTGADMQRLLTSTVQLCQFYEWL